MVPSDVDGVTMVILYSVSFSQLKKKELGCVCVYYNGLERKIVKSNRGMNRVLNIDESQRHTTKCKKPAYVATVVQIHVL